MSERSNPKRARLIDALNLYRFWSAGEPGVTEKEVREAYIKAETAARALEEKLNRKIAARHPVTMERLEELGIDPETLEPLEEESS